MIGIIHLIKSRLKKYFTYLTIIFILVNSVKMSYSQKIDPVDTFKLKEVFVSANKIETELNEPPFNSLVIKKDEINKNMAIKLSDILEEQNGIFLVPDYTVGGMEGVQIQGISADYIQILIDGLPAIGRLSGNIDLERFNLDNVKQIEIIKGPSSSLYGSAALGGVINLITRKKDFNSKVKINQSLGTNDLFDTNLTLTKKFKSTNVLLGLNSYSYGGYDLDNNDLFNTVDPKKNHSLMISVNTLLKDNIEITQSFKLFNENVSGTNIKSKLDEINILTKILQSVNKTWKINYEFHHANYKNNNEIVSSGEINSYYYHKLNKPEIRVYNSNKNNSVLGLSIENEILERSLFNNKINTDLYSIFFQYDFKLNKKIFMLIGSRFDNHTNYKSRLSSKAGLKIYHNNTISTYFSFGQGYKTPDFRQLYLNFSNNSVGYSVFGKYEEKNSINNLIDLGEILSLTIPENELGGELKPESSTGLNIGIKLNFKNIKSELNFFRNDIKNLIDTRVIARKINGQNVFGYINLDNILTTGFELSNNYVISDKIDISFKYQHLYSVDKDLQKKVKNNEIFARDPVTLQSILLKGKDVYGLPNRSRNNFSIGLDYLNKYFLKLRYRDRFGLFDTNGNEVIDRFDNSIINKSLVVNFSVRQKINDNINLSFGIKNLTNYKNTEYLPNIYGREFLLKLNFKL